MLNISIVSISNRDCDFIRRRSTKNDDVNAALFLYSCRYMAKMLTKRRKKIPNN